MSENINIKSDGIVSIARGQAVVEAKSPVEQECKILSASAWAVTTPGEIFAGEIRYNGKVTFDCLVLADNNIECVTAVAEFSDKITAADITAGMIVTLVPEVINVEATMDGGNIKLVAVVDTAAMTVVSREYNCLSVPDEGIYAEKRDVEYVTVSAEQSETVYIADSTAVNKVNGVVSAVGRVAIGSAEAADGEIKVNGTLYTDVLLRSEDGAITTCRIVTPFAKSIAALGAAEGDTAYATAAVTDNSVTYIEGENRIETSATVCINVIALSCRTVNAVVDVFCADNEIETKQITAVCRTTERFTAVTDTVDGQVPIAADKPAADNVVCVTGVTCTLSSVKIEDKRVIAEGLVGGDIVYYNAENNVCDSLAFRLPFSMPLSVHTDMTEVVATATVTDVAVRVRRESVFDIKAEVAFALRLSSEKECTFIENVKLGEPLPRPDASVIIHIAKPGETLWQAAKSLCCSPENVERQNACTAPYAGGERLVNFCKR